MTRPPKDAALHRLQGTRPHASTVDPNDESRVFIGGRLKMPAEWKGTPKEEIWKLIFNPIQKRKTLTRADSPAATIIVEMWMRWQTVSALAAENPIETVSWVDKQGVEHFKQVESPASKMWVALRSGAMRSDLGTEQLKRVLQEQYRRPWIIYISPHMSKAKFLRYAGRYVRRPPIPLNHILKITNREVRFLAKDTRAKRRVELVWPKEMFVAALAQHLSDRYLHAMRYFGLLAPRSKRRTFAALLVLLKQEKRLRPARLGWADSLWRDFRVSPLVDRSGEPMLWVGRREPMRF